MNALLKRRESIVLTVLAVLILSLVGLVVRVAFVRAQAMSSGYGWIIRNTTSAFGQNTYKVSVVDTSNQTLTADSIKIWYTRLPSGSQLTKTCSSASACSILGLTTGTYDVLVNVQKSGYKDFWGKGVNAISFPGGYSTITDTAHLVVSSGGPNTENLNPPPNAWLNYNPSFNVRLTSPASQNIKNITQKVLNVDTGVLTTNSISVNQASPSTYTIPADPARGEGWYGWGIEGKDAASPTNRLAYSSGSSYQYFGIDQEAPTVSCSLIYFGSVFVSANVTDPLLSDGHAGSGFGLGHLEVSVNGGPWTTNGLPTPPGYGQGDITTSLSSTGYGPVTSGNTYEFRFRARDNTVNGSGTNSQWSAYQSCGTYTPTGVGGPDFVVGYKVDSNNNITTNQQITANCGNSPCTVPGSRKYGTSTSVRLCGWVVNAGTNYTGSVSYCVVPNRDPTLRAPSGSCASVGGTPVTLSKTTWNISGSVKAAEPFGSACANVASTDPGIINTTDILAENAKVGSTNPTDILNFDLNDDGVINTTDANIVSGAQFNTTCRRNVNFTTSTAYSSYNVWAWVDPSNAIAENQEYNNFASDPYKVTATGNVTVGLTTTSSTIKQGERASYNVTVTSQSGFDGSVGLEVVNINSLRGNGVFPIFDNTQVDVPLGGSVVTTLNIYTKTDVPINTSPGYSIIVRANSGLPISADSPEQHLLIKAFTQSPWAYTTLGNVGALGNISGDQSIVLAPESRNFLVTHTPPPDTLPNGHLVYKDDGTYALCHPITSSTTAHANLTVNPDSPMDLGFSSGVPGACQKRLYTYFDTSALPGDAIISAAAVQFQYNTANVSQNFDVELVSKRTIPDFFEVCSTCTGLDKKWHWGDPAYNATTGYSGPNLYQPPYDKVIFNTSQLAPAGGTGTGTSPLIGVSPDVINGGLTAFELKARVESTSASAPSNYLTLKNMFEATNGVKLTIWWRRAGIEAQSSVGVGHGYSCTTLSTCPEPYDPYSPSHVGVGYSPSDAGVGACITSTPVLIPGRGYITFDPSFLESVPVGKVTLVFQSGNWVTPPQPGLSAPFPKLISKSFPDGTPASASNADQNWWHPYPNPRELSDELDSLVDGLLIYPNTYISVNPRHINPDGKTKWELRIDSLSDKCTLGSTSFSLGIPPLLQIESKLLGSYTVVADGVINNFSSVKNWLVPSYINSGGINTGYFGADIFCQLWNQFGAGNNNVNVQDQSGGSIPGPRGVYASPSKAAIDCSSTSPDFNWSGGSIPNPTEPVVLFINGNLNINSNLNLGGKKVAFIVRGNISVDPSVHQADGYFVTNGTFTSGTCTSGISCQLTVFGGVTAFGGLNLGRDVGTANSTEPGEIIKFDPSYLYYFARLPTPTSQPLLGRYNRGAKELPP